VSNVNEGEVSYDPDLILNWNVTSDERDCLKMEDGTLVAEWKNEKVYVYDEKFHGELLQTIEDYEGRNKATILREYLSDSLFPIMSNEQILTRLSDLLLSMCGNMNNYNMYYELSEKAKKEILSRMK
jgi:hypothetical protein